MATLDHKLAVLAGLSASLVADGPDAPDQVVGAGGANHACKLYNILYNLRMKDVIFIDSALDDLRAFPPTARQRAGFQIDTVQRSKAPSDWRPMQAIGAGVREIRIHSEGHFGSFMSQSLKKRSTSCIAFRKNCRKPARQILIWPKHAIKP